MACAVLRAALRALLRAPHAALLYIILHCWIGLRWSSRKLRGALRGGLRASIAHGRRIAGCVRAAGALLSLVLLLLLLLLVLMVLMLLLVRRGSATRTRRAKAKWIQCTPKFVRFFSCVCVRARA